MVKRSEKLIFLLVVAVCAFFAKTLYPTISGIPPATADQSAQTVTAGSSTIPLLVLSPLNSTATSSAPFVDSQTGENTPNTIPPQLTTNTDTIFTAFNNQPIPSFSKEGYLVADLDTGVVLSGSNISTRWPTASLTKWMTATLVFDNIPTSTQITITPQMFAADPDEATLVVGDTYSVEDLLHLLLMPSSNVAAEAMADYFGRAQFMQDMNERAQEWGMKDTYFDDPSGISAANQSTPADLLILAQHVYENYPEILAITDTPTTTITEVNSGRKLSVASINDFAGEPNFIGGKTGHTTQAGGNLLSIFNYEGHPVLIIVLDTVDRFGDTSKLLSWFKNNFH